ncbi:unnamed protein product, partial [Ectocarpus sp. 13 AM-2016]
KLYARLLLLFCTTKYVGYRGENSECRMNAPRVRACVLLVRCCCGATSRAKHQCSIKYGRLSVLGGRSYCSTPPEIARCINIVYVAPKGVGGRDDTVPASEPRTASVRGGSPVEYLLPHLCYPLCIVCDVL